MEILPDNKTFLLTKKSGKKNKYKFVLKKYYEDYSSIR